MNISRGLRAIAILGGLAILGLAVADLPRRGIASRAPSVVRADGGCSLASLNGPYAVDGQGTVVVQLPGLPAPPAPFAESSLANFDGAGTFSGHGTVSIGGVALLPTFTGTYAVNSDCTGNLTVNTNLGLTVQEAFVVIGGGQRVITTETDPLAVVERRVERLGD